MVFGDAPIPRNENQNLGSYLVRGTDCEFILGGSWLVGCHAVKLEQNIERDKLATSIKKAVPL